MQIGELLVPTWLNIKTEIKRLGIFFEENLKSAASKVGMIQLRKLVDMHIGI
jgi:hypothetical protein